MSPFESLKNSDEDLNSNILKSFKNMSANFTV